MRFGPTSLQLTSVLAKGLHRPKLRSDLIFSEQVIAGERSFVVKIPESDSFARYGDFAFELLQACDGDRTAAEIAEFMSERHPDQALSERDVIEFIESTDPNTWERTLGEKNLALLSKIRDERKHRAERSSLLYYYLSAWNPNRMLERIHPYLRWMYTRGFLIFSVLLFLTTFLIVVGDYARIRQDTVEFYNFTHKTTYDLWIFWVLLFVISGIHEFGHGLTCKHFGGAVDSMGLMLVFFTPSFFTDCTEMCMFDKTGKRLWTIFAGIWIELVTCGVSTLVWYFSPPGSFLGDLGYKMLLLTGVSGVFINLNPLMKFDGYFALSQYLEMETLREDSFAYTKAWVQRYFLHQEVALPPANRRKQRIYLIFGVAATLYGIMILLIVGKFVKNIFSSKFGDFWGLILTAGVIYLILRKNLRKWVPGWLAGLREMKEKFMAWKMTRLQQAGGIVLLLVIVAVPTAQKVDTDFILEPGAKADVRAFAPGWVAQVQVHEGQRVEAGAVLANLRNPSLEARATVISRQLEQAQQLLFAAQARSNFEETAKEAQETKRLRTALDDARAKVNGLTLRTPIAGVVATPQVEQMVGTYVAAGQEVIVVVDRSSMKARVLVQDIHIEEVHAGAQTKLKVRALPLSTFSGRVEQILPAAASDQPIAEPAKPVRYGQELTNYFAVILQIPNPKDDLREGMTGTAKIYGNRYPIVWRVLRNVWRWGRSLIF
jgi:putative peptide zinc metalloprotease protein